MFIAIAPDSDAVRGTVPRETAEPSVALRTYRLIAEHPYRYTSDDVLFLVYADRNGIAEGERAAARKAFFAKPKACLRASALTKSYGWGVHADADARLALYGVETEEYRTFLTGKGIGNGAGPVSVTYAMRAKR